jgi:hypothetical protein
MGMLLDDGLAPALETAALKAEIEMVVLVAQF